MALTRIRSDGRHEVADTTEANEMFGCPLDFDCILVSGHSGDCDYDREVWVGAGVPYGKPDLPASREPDAVEKWLKT